MNDNERQRLIDLLRAVHSAHRDLVERTVDLEEWVKTRGDLKDLADTALVLRESEKYANGSRKELGKLLRKICTLYTTLWASDPSSDLTVSTEWCSSCEPDPRRRVSEPKPSVDGDENERYKRALRHFGVPESAIDTEVLRLSHNDFGDYLTRMARSGEEIPEDIRDEWSYTEYRLKIRARSGALSSALGPVPDDASSKENLHDRRNEATEDDPF